MNQETLVAFLKRCDAITTGEADLLDTWAAKLSAAGDAALSGYCDQRAQWIRQESVPRTAGVVDQAEGADESEVKQVPSDEENAELEKREGYLADRSKFAIATLTDTAIRKNANSARANATKTADLAETVLPECIP